MIDDFIYLLALYVLVSGLELCVHGAILWASQSMLFDLTQLTCPIEGDGKSFRTW